MNKNNKVWIGFDLGGTKMLSKVFDDNFNTLSTLKLKTEGVKGAENGIEKIIYMINKSLSDISLNSRNIAGIGIGCPGIVNSKLGTLVKAPNLNWNNIPIKEHLENQFKCHVVVCNDVDAGVYAEYKMGKVKNSKSIVGIFPGTGIGAGAVINGKILQGSSLSCMEIGHIPIYPEISGKGEYGSTLEKECSRLKIASDIVKAAYKGLAPYIYSKCGTDLSKVTSSKIAKAINEGDDEVKNIVIRSANILGCGVATIVNLISPEYIVMGGGLVEAMPKLYLNNVKKSAQNHAFDTYKNTFKIVISELKDDASVLGAVIWAKDSLENNY